MIRDQNLEIKSVFKNVLVFLLALMTAVLARKYILVPFGMGTRSVWLTFHPMMLVVALYCGWQMGILFSFISCYAVLYHWSFFSAQPFITDHGDWIGLLAFIFNCLMMTAVCGMVRKSKKKAIHEREKADTANRAKSVFLASMSHEIRTPLSSILGFSELMRNDVSLSSEHRHMISIINRSGGYLLSLINNVLDMAKIESGRIIVENRTFDLIPTIVEIIDLMKQRAASKGIQLSVDFPKDQEMVVDTDEAKLRQIVINLIGNAVAYTSTGGVTLRLRKTTDKQFGYERIEIEVADTGEGIAPEDQKRIFEPFVQLGGRKERKGTGLGLTITRQFVEMMGGTITLRSTVGIGSVFKVEIPVETDGKGGKAEAGLPIIPPVRLASGQPELRVLIIEDDEDNWMLLRKYLLDAGFMVQVADNKVEGIEKTETFQPHFIWMGSDLKMVESIGMIRNIRQLDHGKTVKIGVFSTSVFKKDHEGILAAGADLIVVKPIDFGLLFQRMEENLGIIFIHDRQPLTDDMPVELDSQELSSLPPSLKKELTDALVSLDKDRIFAVISRVIDENADIGKMLEEYVKRFRYSAILRALKEEIPV